MEDSFDKKPDSVFSLVKELSSHFSEKNALGPSEKKLLKKQYFQAAYECLLHKRQVIKEGYDPMKDQEYSLDIVQCEVLSAIQVYHKNRWEEVKSFALPLFRKLNGIKFNPNEEQIIASLLKMIVLIHKHSPRRDTEPPSLSKFYFIRPRSEFLYDWEKRLKSSKTNLFFPTVPTRIKNDPAIRGLFFSDKSVKHPVLGKMKKSLTWNERMSEFVEGYRPHPAPHTHTSQNLDEGYVTPNDDHREVTPEPAIKPAAQVGKDFSDLFTWEVVKDPPKFYYSWDIVGLGTEDRWKHRELSFRNAMCHIHKDSSQKSVLSSAFLRDICALLTGLESSSFVLKNGEFTVRKEVICIDSEPIFAEDCTDLLQCGTYYYLLHNFVMKCRSQINSPVKQAFCHTLHCYLLHYATLVGKPKSQGLQNLLKCPIRPREHLHYLCKIIGLLETDENEFSCQSFLEQLYLSLFKITDQDLLNLILFILYKCTDAYVLQFENLIRTGEITPDLGSGYWDLSRVPSFLVDMKNTISESSRSLYLFQKYGNILRSRHELRAKVSTAKVDCQAEAQKSLREHLAKFLKEQEERNAAIARIKQEKLQEILDDIESKRSWKETEAQKILERDIKIANYYDKVDQIKESLLEDAKSELIAKCEALNQQTEKLMNLTEWKTKRLNNSKERQALFRKEMNEDEKFRKKCVDERIDLKVANAHLLVQPIAVETSISPQDEVDGEDMEYCYSRSEDARSNKLKSTVSSTAFKFDPSSRTFDRENFTVDSEVALEEYKLNKLRAQATRQTVMSSDLTAILGNQFEQKDSGFYKGLSEEEMQLLEQSWADLTVVKDHKPSSWASGPNIPSQMKKPYVEKLQEKRQVTAPTYARFCKHLSSCHLMLKEKVMASNQSVLEMLKDDFLDSVDSLRKYFLLENSNWSWNLSKELVDLMRSHCGFGYTKLNRLLPLGFSTMVTGGDSVGNLDPTQPSCLDHLSLSYRPPCPIDFLLVDKVLDRYQAIFNFLKQLECGSEMLKIVANQLRAKDFKRCGSHSKQIEFHHHVMNHFMLSLRSFIYSNIEVAWSSFKTDAHKTKSIDELFKIHCTFLNNVSMLCCLKGKVRVLLEYIRKVVRSIYLFCEVVRCSYWSTNDEGNLENSKATEMQHTFETFLGQAKILVRYLRKLLNAGFDGSLANLKHFLELNNYYCLPTDERSLLNSSHLSTVSTMSLMVPFAP